MIQYIIMSWLIGYSGNKLFGKDKDLKNSIKWGCITGTVLYIIYNFLKAPI
jgi:hypothetical protein